MNLNKLIFTENACYKAGKTITVKALLAADTKEDTEDTSEPVVTYPEKLTSGYYRVLSNAKATADKNPGTYVFTNDGTAIYPATTAESYRTHTVVKGDTLWDIAQKYLGSGTRYTEIVKLNGLTSNVIYSGMKLKIPN